MALNGDNKLELWVINEVCASWMTFSNTVPGWSAADRPDQDLKERFWSGVLFKIPQYYKSYETGEWLKNPAQIVIQPGEVIIPTADLEQGKWLHLILGTDGRQPPMKIVQSQWCLLGTLHKSMDPFPGGVVVWDRREKPFHLQTVNLGSPNYMCRFIFTFEKADDFAAVVYDGSSNVTAPNLGSVTKIEIHGGIGGPSNILNPPQY